MEAAGARVLGEAEARTSAEGLVVAASLELPRVSPREVLAELAIEPPETRDPEVLQRLEGSAELRLREGVLRVEPLSLTVDDTELTGQASVSDFATPAFAFELGADALDLDRYLPPEAEEDAAGTPGGAAAAGAAELPVETLRALNLDGRITVAELKAYGVRAREVELVVRAADGELRVHPLNASLYGGQYQGDVRVDATGDEARIRVDERLEAISAGPLLTDLMGFEKLLGTASLSLQASTTGRTTDALLETLSGEARFEFLDGAVKGINIARMLREGVARLRGGSLEAAAEARRTDFSSLTGTIDLDGGIARNLDFEAKTPLLRITGEGTVNLIEQMVDYALTVNVVDTLSGQGGEELQALRRVAVPLRFTGSLTDPDISLAVGEALRGVAEERVREEVEEKQQEAREKVEEKVGEKLDEEVGDRLRNLLGE
ncbi:MAG: AsmA family protein [Arhodomonas sp.]|nr:AsmA family protein [Arhodomonas sp.]